MGGAIFGRTAGVEKEFSDVLTNSLSERSGRRT